MQEGHGGECEEIVVCLHEEVCEGCPAGLAVEFLREGRMGESGA